MCTGFVLQVGNEFVVFPVVHTVSLGVAQHIAGNILHDIIYVVLADRGTVKKQAAGSVACHGGGLSVGQCSN